MSRVNLDGSIFNWSEDDERQEEILRKYINKKYPDLGDVDSEDDQPADNIDYWKCDWRPKEGLWHIDDRGNLNGIQIVEIKKNGKIKKHQKYWDRY